MYVYLLISISQFAFTYFLVVVYSNQKSLTYSEH
jgi:hypothetical protein